MKAINGYIKDFRFGIDYDYNKFMLQLCLTMKGSECWFGSTTIGETKPNKNLEVSEIHPGNFMAYYISKVFEVVGVKNINDLKGKPVRVIIDDGLCIGIQNYLDENIFFIPSLYWDNEHEISIKDIVSDTSNMVFECSRDKYMKSQNLNPII